jgi:hypothetical protein
MRSKNFKMVLFTEKCRQIGGQGIHELLPLGTVMLFQPAQILVKARMPRLPETTRESAVNHCVLAIVQTDASALVNEPLDPREIGRCPDKFTPLRKGAGGRRCSNGSIRPAGKSARSRRS